MYEWLVKKAGLAVAWLIIIVLVAVVLFGAYKAVDHYFTGDLKREVKLEKGQTGAAIESGHKSVEIVGNRQSAETNGAATVEEAQHEIDNAADPGGVTDAGINGLHAVRRQADARHSR